MTRSLEKALVDHSPWYDSFDQSSDSWGCLCDKIARYRTREDVVKQHIAPTIRQIMLWNERIIDVENKIRSQSNHGAWRDIDRLVKYCQIEGMPRLAGAFKDYEDERQRLHRAIDSLESQLSRVVDAYRKTVADYRRLTYILNSAGIDPDVLIKTDDLFSEPDKHPKP